MPARTVQIWARGALVSLLFLIFVGAIVRVTGAGLGCPDWPKCWGQTIPPTKAEEVDFAHLDLEKFRKKAARLGRDPASVTEESLRAEFNPVHTWTEFINRVASFPVTIFSLGLLVVCIRGKNLPRAVRINGGLSFFVVLLNALIGAAVVYSGLHTGIITLHLTLAFVLIGHLVYTSWAAPKERTMIPGPGRASVGVLLAVVMIEGLLGTQIREMTDTLQLSHLGEARHLWIHELERTWTYLIHRSFSWVIFFGAIWVCWRAGWQGTVPRLVLFLVTALMLMGIVLSQKGIVASVQVLHVGFAGILVAALFHWYLAAEKRGSQRHGN